MNTGHAPETISAPGSANRKKNAAWDLPRELRELFQREQITPQTHPQAFEALLRGRGKQLVLVAWG
jgi:hypothetical protein